MANALADLYGLVETLFGREGLATQHDISPQWVFSFPLAAVTNHHKFSDLQQTPKECPKFQTHSSLDHVKLQP